MRAIQEHLHRGRQSAYTVAEVTWDKISYATMTYLPGKFEIGTVDMKS